MQGQIVYLMLESCSPSYEPIIFYHNVFILDHHTYGFPFRLAASWGGAASRQHQFLIQ